jgi:hypothetical protein
LFIGVSVFQLVVDVDEVAEFEFSLSLDVQQSEVSLPAFFVEGAALSKIRSTILAVSSLRKPSKSRADPLVASWIS